MRNDPKDSRRISIGGRVLAPEEPTYFIAEIGANFNGSFDEACRLADVAKASGAECAKYQTFRAETLVSAPAFAAMRASAHQARWSRPVHEVYREAEFPREWHRDVAAYCREIGVEFLSSPYDHAAVDLLEEIGVAAYKVGSGDITYLELVDYIAQTGKPILLGTGASDLADVERCVEVIQRRGADVLIMQCTTSYPAPFHSANLRVLPVFEERFGALTGLSDHTPGHVAVLGAVALGARCVEKHFTASRDQVGPDHPHSMEPHEFAAMVSDTRDLEAALGSPVKQVTPEERDTVIVQRRSLCAARDIAEGEEIRAEDLVALRPQTAFRPYEAGEVVGRRARRAIARHETIAADAV
jgi:sialic acid synthase SpsE